MKKTLQATAALTFLLVGAANAAQPAPSCKTVRYSNPGWTDIASTNALMKTVLEPLGYKMDAKTLSVPITFQGLTKGELDVFLGNWMPAQKKIAVPLVKNGKIEVLGVNLSGNRFALAVPAYVAKEGVTSVEDLDANGDKFGRTIYGIEPGAPVNQNILQMIKDDAFGLGDWKLVSSSEQGMLSQVARSDRSKKWIVFPAWEPHPMNTRYDLTYLKGGDKYFGKNMGSATVRTVGRPGFAKDCPNLAAFYKNLSFTVDLENRMMSQILDDKISADKAASEALKKNPKLLDKWLAGVKTIDGKPGLPAVKSALGL